MSLPETCPSCNHPRPERYCGNCGERRVDANELSLGRFFQALGAEFVPGIETDEDKALGRAGGRVFRTVYTLFRWPGRLTADYIAGRRRPYLKPVQVYLTISVIFFIFGTNFFQYVLGEYEYVLGFGETAEAVAAEAHRRGETLEEYTKAFNERLAAQKKAMFAVIVPVYALGMLPLYRRRRYGEHLIYSIHLTAALLLFMVGPLMVFFYILIEIVRMLVQMDPRLERPLNMLFGEGGVIVAVYVPLIIYQHHAVRRVYGGNHLVTFLKVVALSFWHAILIVFVFRLGLFFTTFYSMKWLG